MREKKFFVLPRYSLLRRLTLLIVLTLFILQLFRVKVLVGGLSGSLLISWIKLLDPFAYLESLLASKNFNLQTLWAVLPVLLIYFIFGRSFCGWICPMDLLFGLLDRLKVPYRFSIAQRISSSLGFLVFFSFLGLSFFFSLPLFTNYFSHLTNFFRAITGIYFFLFDLPVDLSLLVYSLSLILFLLIMELILPRFWCRILCPVGKFYGLLNKVSLLHLRYKEGECFHCRLCDRQCYMGVNVSQNVGKGKLRSQDCIYCGNCVEACETKGKIVKFKIGV
uniref:4Fe-4S binding protein n=1 Tax=Caldimicrobium thiodismutans TaxID=1653476 RepID=A0A832GL91_9BACT